jgi:hypothetical protein
LSLEPFFAGHALKGGIERALFDAQGIGGGLVNALRDGVAVLAAGAGQDFEDQEVERAQEAVVSMLGHKQPAMDSWFC